jgi:phosphoribosylanthranilate isomerase
MIMDRLEADRAKVTFLFDASGGKGLPIDVERVRPFIRHCHLLGWASGTAGGLTPDNLPQLRPLFDICRIAVDTESWPRDADDKLDIGKARAFWQAGLELYK